MRTFGILFGFLIFTQLGISQKLVRKTLVNTDVAYIQIDAKNCFAVDISTIPGNEMVVEASMEGEYKKDLAISLEEDSAALRVGASFLPNFTHPNDKLSAHKVISIKLQLKIPEYKEVRLYGTSSNVQAAGSYKALKIVLADGDCTLKEVSENVDVKTQTGNIVLIANKGSLDAKSTYGRVTLQSLKDEYPTFVLTSIEGDITVSYPK